jgi:flagellar assembly protein FliH
MNLDVLVDWSAAPLPPSRRPSWLVLEPPPSAPARELLDDGAAAVAPPGEGDSDPPPASVEEEEPPRVEAILPPPSDRPLAVCAPPEPEASEECEALRAALVHAISAGVRARRHALVAAERDLVELATAMARQIIARELATAPALVVSWAREGVAALGQQDQVVVAVAPDVAALVPADAWASALDGLATLVVDRSLPPQGCEVRGRYGRVDVGVEARLASVIDALGGPRPVAPEEAP